MIAKLSLVNVHTMGGGLDVAVNFFCEVHSTKITNNNNNNNNNTNEIWRAQLY